MPLVSHWWHPRSSASQGDSVNSVREEILRTLYALQLHVDALIQPSSDDIFPGHVESVLDALWVSIRRGRIECVCRSATSHSHLFPPNASKPTFSVSRPYDLPNERRWAAVEVIALLESTYSTRLAPAPPVSLPGEEPIPKRRRVDESPSRLLGRLGSNDSSTKLTALQVLPFFLLRTKPSLRDISNTLAELTELIGNKQSSISSWAMIACARLVSSPPPTPLLFSQSQIGRSADPKHSYAVEDQAKDATLLNLWKQIWQLSVRTISIPSNSRAACALLHSILDSHLIPHHEIVNDINGIVTAADISGPALLVDSSLRLMLHLLHLRNAMLPNANQATSNHIIRWVFSRWRPGTQILSG